MAVRNGAGRDEAGRRNRGRRELQPEGTEGRNPVRAVGGGEPVKPASAPRPIDNANDISNVLLALAVLDHLGGATKFVDIEDVAIDAFKIAPDRFGWRTKQYPSWERVRTAFVHANQNEQRRGGQPLVVSDTDGSSWKLTADGVTVVRKNAVKTEAATGRKRSHAGAASPSGRRIRDIRKHSAFTKYSQGASVSDIARYELAEVLMCPPDSSATVVLRKLDVARAAALNIDDKEVLRFLTEIAQEVGRKWS